MIGKMANGSNLSNGQHKLLGVATGGGSSGGRGPHVEFVAISPALAKEYLATQLFNRRILRPKVVAYAGDMLRGAWNISESAICFDADGHLINGQHRLQAVIESGVTITALVMRNVPREAQTTMDTGRVRTFDGILSMRGEANARLLAAATRNLAVLADPPSRHRWTHSLSDQVLSLNREALDLSVAALNVSTPWRNSGIVGAVAFCYRATPDTALVFAEKLVSGAGLEADDPILSFRNHVTSGNAPRAGEDLAPQVVQAIWNFHHGARIKRFTPPRGDRAVEFFRQAHPRYA